MKAIGLRASEFHLGNRRLYLYLSGLALLAGILVSLSGADQISPWLRVIVGLLVFMMPGCYLFALIPVRDSWDIIDVAGYGFAYSVALITVLGLITRTVSLSIESVEFIWYLLSALGFASVTYKWRQAPPIKMRLRAPVAVMLAIVIVQLALYMHSSILATPTTDDQNRHHAAVNGFLRDEPLGWSEPYYETGNRIADRMYMTYWVLAQALVVEISGVPILLTRFLINPFVVLMAVAGMYVFARNLAHRRPTALVYVVLGLLAYGLVTDMGPQPGSQFFVRALLDKVVAAFALAPIAISSAYLCAVSGRRRAWMGFALSFFAASSAHAIPGGFAVCIIGIWCGIRLVSDRPGRTNAFAIGILTLLLFLPAVFVRLSTAEKTIYTFEGVTNSSPNKMFIYDVINPLDNGNRFYAINALTAGHLTYVLAIAMLMAILARRPDPRSKLMLAYVVAVGIGLIPYTAWLYGRLVSFDHVQRILWLMPYGYMLGFVIVAGWAVISRRAPRANARLDRVGRDRTLGVLCAIALLLTALLLQRNSRVDFGRDISDVTSGEIDWLEIAQIIDARHDERVWIAASPESRNRAITLHWKVIGLSRYSAERMSYYSNMSLEQAQAQRTDNFRLFDGAVPVEVKLEIVDRYGLDYLVFPAGYAWMVDALYQTDKQRFELVYSGETLRLVRVHEKSIAADF